MINSYIKGWVNTSETKTDLDLRLDLKVTILVAVRNEEKFIKTCLKSLLNQTYSIANYEIIVLDDFSNDKTVSIVNSFSKIKLLQLSEFLGEEYRQKANKKRAITLGIENAENDLIITTDGDCSYDNNWLRSMVQEFSNGKSKMITAPVLFYSEKGFVSKFLELDLISLMGITCSTLTNDTPSMVNGANLMFEKQTFIEVNGYDGNEHIPSGDDVFLMQKINEKYPKSISFLKNIDSIVYTYPPFSFNEFINQRIRWTSKSVLFADKFVKFNLILNYFFYLSLFSNFFVFSFFNLKFLFIGLFMFLVKIIIDFIFFTKLLKFVKRKSLINYLVSIELTHVVYVGFLGFLSVFGKFSWKGRKF